MSNQDKEYKEFQEFYQKYFCDNCMENMPGVRIQCSVCIDFDLCVRCFSLGAELGDHLNSHSYRIMKKGGFDPFSYKSENTSSTNIDTLKGQPCNRELRKSTSSTSLLSKNSNGSHYAPWSSVEHIRLLQGIEQYGYGNWSQISKFVESKSIADCEKQYKKCYVEGAVGKYTLLKHLAPLSVIDQTALRKESPLSGLCVGKLLPSSIGGYEAFHLNYSHHRDDFDDVERLDEEKLISQIDDNCLEYDDLDIALNLSQCDIYQRQSKEQSRRKRLSRDHQLQSKFFASNPTIHTDILKNYFSNEEIQTYKLQLRLGNSLSSTILHKSLNHLFCICFTKQESQQQIFNIEHEKRLKRRIKELQKYRRNGISKKSEMLEFERKKIKRILERTTKMTQIPNQLSNIPKQVIIDAVSKYFSGHQHFSVNDTSCVTSKKPCLDTKLNKNSSMSFEGAFKAFLENKETQNKNCAALHENGHNPKVSRRILRRTLDCTRSVTSKARVTRSTSNLAALKSVFNANLETNIKKSTSSPQIQCTKIYELRGSSKGLVAN